MSMFRGITKKLTRKSDKDGKKDKDEKKSREKSKSRRDRRNPKYVPLDTRPPEYTQEDLLKPVPLLASVPSSERANLFIKKLKLCCVLFRWEPVDEMQVAVSAKPESEETQKAKEAKREILIELLDQMGKNRSFVNEQVLVELIRMVSCNLFRTLPDSDGDEDDEDARFEPAWPHLQIVYEFFLRFIVSNDLDTKMVKKHVNPNFVLHILELFNGEDPRERDYLKTILHRIYAKFMSLRSFIRRAINNTFYKFIYSTESHNGVAELLEILGSIINGFALPLKQEHVQFLQRVLIPMHKVKPLANFHQQLSYCVTQFINKDAELAVPVLEGLMKYWPVTNSQKEVLFLNEMEEVLELTQPAQFKIIMAPLVRQIARTIGSPHFQVAERALFLWHNEYYSSLVADHRDVLLPILFPVLHVNSQHHWNPTVNNLTVNVLKIFMDMDGALVERCTQEYAKSEKRKEEERQNRLSAWAKLEEATRKQREAKAKEEEEKTAE